MYFARNEFMDTIRPHLHDTRHLRVNRRTLMMMLPVALFSVFYLVFLTPAERAVATPATGLADLCILFVVTLWNRDKSVPAFELGTICILMTTAYSLVPLVNFYFGGLAWTNASDGRLLFYNATPEETGAFAWRYVLYLASLVTAYLAARGRAYAALTQMNKPDRASVFAIVGLLAAFEAYFPAVETAYGVSFAPSYRDLFAGTITSAAVALPYAMQQLSHNLWGMMIILKLCVLAILVQKWESRKWRAILAVWLLTESLLTVFRMGSRTDLVMLLLSAVLLYHRLVKPMTFWTAVSIGSLLLGSALLYGIARDMGGNFSNVVSDKANPLTASNEFQAMFAVVYDTYMRKNAGLIGDAPWQFFANDLLLLIPSQLLPFDKLDPSFWLGSQTVNGGVGLIGGPVAQSIGGLGWIELVLRGGVLGYVFAMIHRWYVRHSSSFWVTLFYLFLCIWSYYTFRSSTFYIVYYVVYRFIPVLLLVHFGRFVITSLNSASAKAASSASH